MNSVIKAANPKSVSVIGLGYIGLPTAAMFASSGHRVFGVDVSPRAVDAVNSGSPHIEEQGLEALVFKAVKDGLLSASLTPQAADAFIIAVPTPVDHDSHLPDVSYVEAAGRAIAPFLRSGNLIVLESTSPVGTTRLLAKLLSGLRPDLVFPLEGEEDADIRLAYCPERIIPGHMIRELVENDRIVGGMSVASTVAATELYKSFVRGECLAADDRTAELCKLTENAFRDVNIAFANELSMICGDVGLDAWKVIELANRHPRVNILNPGPGVGGHCIAVDPWFIVAGAPERARIIRTAREVNDSKPLYVLSQVEEALSNKGEGSRIVCLGLTYKPDVDDFRESPALQIVRDLSDRYPGRVIAVDPYESAYTENEGPAGQVEFKTLDEALSGDPVVVLLVGHRQFKSLVLPPSATLIDTSGFLR